MVFAAAFALSVVALAVLSREHGGGATLHRSQEDLLLDRGSIALNELTAVSHADRLAGLRPDTMDQAESQRSPVTTMTSLTALGPPARTFLHPTDPVFVLQHATQKDQGKIQEKYMVCCERRGLDFHPEAYINYWGDFPVEPECIPGYHKLADGACAACDENTWCGRTNDFIEKCPVPLVSALGAGKVEHCWCPPGSHGSPDAKIEKQMVQHTGAPSREIDEFTGSCMQCLVDHFCPGEIAPLPCTEKTDNGQGCAGYPYETSQWPGEMHPCPPGSDTRGQPGMQYCTCKPGHTGSYSIGGVDSSDCVLVPASSPGLYSPDGAEAIECGNHTASPEGATSFADCSCVTGYERVGDSMDCVTNCVAEPGQWCGVTGEDEAGLVGAHYHSLDPVLVVFECPQGFFCPGGRGEGKHPCLAPANNYCPHGSSIASGSPCPLGFACAGGQSGKQACEVAPGQFCPSGSASNAKHGFPCPTGSWCAGKDAPALPCTCEAGRYCPLASIDTDGSLCEAGYVCKGGASDHEACDTDPGFFCGEGYGGSTSGEICPVGQFCLGGMSDKAPCTAAPGSFCPAGSSDPKGVLCPVGWWCAGGAEDKRPCACEPGFVCSLGSTSEAGLPCPAGYGCNGGQDDKTPCMARAGSSCPEGSETHYGYTCGVGEYCAGAAAQAAPCQCAAGHFCSNSSSSPDGRQCDPGYFCAGGVADKEPCTVFPGNYCPRGSSTGTGMPCPVGRWCGGDTALALPCDCEPGSFCAEGSALTTGVPCPEGFACPGADMDKMPCTCEVGFYCHVGSADEIGIGESCLQSFMSLQTLSGSQWHPCLESVLQHQNACR